MTIIWKRLLASALCLCMLMGMCPAVPVFAEDNEEEIIAADPETEELIAEPDSEASEPEEHIHSLEIIPEIAASCTEDGLTEGVVCVDCGLVLVEQEVIPAFGHGDEENGICTVCGTVLTLPEEEAEISEPIEEAAEEDEPLAEVMEESVQTAALPAVKSVQILCDGEDVSGTAIAVEVGSLPLELQALSLPEGSEGKFSWSSSSTLCLISGTGETVSITAQKLTTPYADVKITLREQKTGKQAAVTLRLYNEEALQLEQKSIVGGQSLTLAVAGVTWSLEQRYAGVASVTAAGKLTTKVVGEPVTIAVVGTAKGTPDLAVVQTVVLLPQVQRLSVIAGEPFHSGVYSVYSSTVQMFASVYPETAQKKGTWKVSPSDIASVTEDGLVTFHQRGKATVTFTASDGSKKSASAVLMHGKPVEGILLEGKDTLASGAKTTLQAVVDGAATQRKVVWSSSNPAAAAVSSTGVVTAKTVYVPTDVVITASSTDGSGVYAEHAMTITPKTNTLAVFCNDAVVNGTTLGVEVDGMLSLSTGESDVTWKSSSPKIIEVEEDGTVTALKSGSATITAKSADGKRTGKVTVRCLIPVEGLEIVAKNVEGDVVLASGAGKVSLKAIPDNPDATIKSVTWSSSDPSVASVSSSGVVTAKSGVTIPTTVTIYAVSKDGTGACAELPVVVAPAAVFVSIVNDEGNVVSGRTLKVNIEQNDTLDLSAAVYPTYDFSSVVWKSSNPKVAEVEDGVVTLLKTGTVTITAVANDGSGKQSSVKLTVGRYASGIEVLNENLSVVGGKKLTLKYALVNDSELPLTSKAVTFSLRSQDAAYASISSTGVITTKKVTASREITATIALKDDPSVNVRVTISIMPA